MKKALLLVDLQNDFCLNGTLAVHDGDAVIDIANQAMRIFHQHGWPVIATLDWHPANHKSFAINSGTQPGEVGTLNGLTQVWWPTHCVQNTTGASLHPQLEQQYINKRIYKGQDPEIDSYSAFFDNGKRSATALHQWLNSENIQHLTVLGLATDYCVKFTVLDALELGYQTEVIAEGCRGVNLAAGDSEKALHEMSAKGARVIQLHDI
ncbi:bifunctional nicotinamidase/pyrazinamidase [Budviciaceae bacterium BWR-B9]|uniref:Bifunctional nicotinamidase/pyrazinamidase n=1 Tax=Limnobaculum allomyrinae TaxID=2791986 RepID=A0ABS1ISK3_9GAMM|nr:MULTISPECIES: bifunctional nicotinamidase/pyrazinamidase [Limnobaculum]MBK5144753.1 bifunctional nicotinamidase/pyrazinamidase [Limnobaculum allomyrinae]MBV7692416.1 bifunctional nicotinamidase/pyrazinamidase [Limnobaculum sp. M2-1]